jgi:ABC-type phosphate/phosphonate transport system substrate-binding protein
LLQEAQEVAFAGAGAIAHKVLVGATSWKTLKQLISSNQMKTSALRITYVSSPIPLDPWLINSSLPLNVQDRIKSCFFDLSDRAILAELGSDGFVPASSATHSILGDTDSIYKELIFDRQP